MKLIGERYRPEYALLPIGGLYTMDPEDALEAVKFLQPKNVIPMHYNTWIGWPRMPNDSGRPWRSRQPVNASS